MEQLVQNWQAWAWAWAAGALAGATLLALLVHRVAFSLIEGVTSQTDTVFDDALVRRTRRPARLIFPLLAVLFALPALPLPADTLALIRHLVSLGLIASVAWAIVESTHIVDDLVDAKYRMDAADNLEARQVRTQIHVLRRFFVAAIAVVTLSVMLMTLPSIRALAASLLA